MTTSSPVCGSSPDHSPCSAEPAPRSKHAGEDTGASYIIHSIGCGSSLLSACWETRTDFLFYNISATVSPSAGDGPRAPAACSATTARPTSIAAAAFSSTLSSATTPAVTNTTLTPAVTPSAVPTQPGTLSTTTLASALTPALASSFTTALAATLASSFTAALASSFSPTLATALASSFATSLAPALAPALASALAPALASSFATSLATALATALASSFAPAHAPGLAPALASSFATALAPALASSLSASFSAALAAALASSLSASFSAALAAALASTSAGFPAPFSVSTGGQFTCALADGEVKCWGQNDYGQLGLGDAEFRGNQPGQLGPALPRVDLGRQVYVTQLSTGNAFSCALIKDARAKPAIMCWGSNSAGQLGQGDTANRGDAPGSMGDALKPVDLGSGLVPLYVGAGGLHACALLQQAATGRNRVKCWGANYSGQLGLEDMEPRGDKPGWMGDKLPFVNLGKYINVIQLSVGGEHNCALVTDSAGKARVKCWGSAEMGQVGYGDTTYRGDVPGTMGDKLPYVELGSGLTPTRVVTGQYATCAFLTPGRTVISPTIKCWGNAQGGQLGTADEEHRGDGPGEMGDYLPAVDLGSGLAVLSISLGLGHGCAVLTDVATGQRLVKCWGLNDYGELGYGDDHARGAAPTEMGDNLPSVDLGTGLTPAQVSCNGYYSCAVLQQAAGPSILKCWGENNAGQLGLGDEDARGDQLGEMGGALPAVPVTF
ncbi:hypothetical protein HXX76_009372 [Chlamydomonas incerta]|uniref:Uncharacterized protein n=1 Tax=Chlamydomonas incerta TaxID=51695 RepID=A0A835VZY3_CHLIN|nr:hypothetical protein HXX76_009372 [Chlamydomonas incerta]|eukprot:KAG2431879.1 hypothetical protein HXX76_009372 [Chlamydomonas incerta]